MTAAGRALRYSLASVVTGFACMVAVPVLMFSAALSLIGVGLFLLPPELWFLGKLADVERARAGRRLSRAIPGHGPRARKLRELITEPGTTRDVRWMVVRLFVGAMLGLLGVGLVLAPIIGLVSIATWPLVQTQALGVTIDSWASALTVGLAQFVLFVFLSLWLSPKLADGDARLSVRLLEPSEREKLSERVETLQVSRAGAVNAHGAELRRIERDLHDGTQARLVSIAMRLGLAERQLDRDPQAVAALLAEARTGAEEAMTELRGVLRTMYPPILADRGLEGALAAVAARSAVPTELSVGELGVVAAPVEAAAYFVVTEALTNVAKHSGATTAQVTVTRDVDVLLAEIVDDGRGGVDESMGTGIAGMRRRLEALDGTLKVTSPVGGPTRIGLEVSCAS
jgi:signal transduction histidine kinase